MPEIRETFETYRQRVEKALEHIDKPIILSTDVAIPIVRGGAERNIEMLPIAWRLYGETKSMFYIVTVPPETRIATHSHNEDVFRFILKGSLTVNGHRVTEGMWFVVKANTPYRIATRQGYRTIMRYSQTCDSTRPGGRHWVDEEPNRTLAGQTSRKQTQARTT